MELNEQEAHCVARILQGFLYGRGYFNGCEFCKYKCVEDGRRIFMRFKGIRQRLMDETGVALDDDFGTRYGFDISLKRFAINANPETVKLYEEHLQRSEARERNSDARSDDDDRRAI